MPVSVSIMNMQHNNFVIFYWKEDNWRASEVSEPLSGLFNRDSQYIREYSSTLNVGLARAVSPTNTNFRITFLLTRHQEALYEDLAV